MSTLKSLRESLDEALKITFRPEDERRFLADCSHLYHWAKGVGFSNDYDYHGPNNAPSIQAVKDPDKKFYKLAVDYLQTRGYTLERPEQVRAEGGVARVLHSVADDRSRPWAMVTHDNGRCKVELLKGSGSGVEDVPEPNNGLSRTY